MIEDKLRKIPESLGEVDIKPTLFKRIRDEKSKVEFLSEYKNLIRFAKVISLIVLILSLIFNFYRFFYSQYFENAKLVFENFEMVNAEQILITGLQFLIGFVLYTGLSFIPFASYLTLKHESA